VFDIDFSMCVFCGLCVDICPPGSISHTRRYEGATFTLSEMVASFGRGMITPEQQVRWAELRQRSGNDNDSLDAETEGEKW
jgi:formate hydrogenlyase subunit 6/NADH:ubiquinone oxidoreductase subunit I